MEDRERLIREYIDRSIEVKRSMAREQSALLLAIGDKCVETLQAGGAIYLCGNGGSAADAQHAATELIGRFLRERQALPAVALTTDTSILTAVGNDYGFQDIFARQVEGLMTGNDLLVGISTSGRSENVLRAVTAARNKGAFTVGLTGAPGEPLASAADLCLCVPSDYTPHIQEAHVLALHIICDLVERAF